MVDGSQPFANTGLQVLDTNASHELIIKPGSNITAERTLTLTTGDADRTITLSGNPTLADWFDQSVKVAATPTFSTLSLSGGQLAFPASQNASADANTLDDYEEGTWTPSVGGNATYGANNGGRYTKIGRVVHIQGYLHINVIGTGSTTTISGLPFASALDTGIAVGYFASLASNVVFVAAYLTGSVVTFASIAAAAASLTSASALIGSSTTIYFNGSYVV
jgi:hypothetical protein